MSEGRIASIGEARGGWRRYLLGFGAGVLVLALLGVLLWRVARPQRNMEAVQELNNRGVGLMEHFDYEDAIPVFEEVVRLAPDWLPGRINLGIALLNAGGDNPTRLPQCQAIFEDVLRREPDNPYAHFCLGILLMYTKEAEQARKHFEAVVQKDPNDAYAWYWLGTLMPEPKEQAACIRKALERDRHLSGALYQRSRELVATDPQRFQAMLAEIEGLKQFNWENVTKVKFSQMGPYAEVIGGTGEAIPPRTGPLPVLRRCDETSVNLPREVCWAAIRLVPKETQWASGANPKTDAPAEGLSELLRLVRGRFGATMVVLDYNDDGKPDLFLAGAVLEKGRLRDLLLRNEGGGRFTDVTAAAGLADPRSTLGCCVADFDNDGHPDLLLTGAGEQHLFRNTGKGTFEDVTNEAGLADLKSVCLTAAAIDLDQDSDLDLLFCQFAKTADEARRLLKGEKGGDTGGLAVYLHKGEALPVKDGQVEPPLKLRYAPAEQAAFRDVRGATVGLAASDMDGDRDLDLLALQDQAPPGVLVNDRLLRFRRSELTDAQVGRGDWNGALVLDVNHDGHSDLFLLPTDQPPRLLLNRAVPGQDDVNAWFQPAVLDAPPLRQAVAVDLDMDTWTDVVGISREGQLVFLHNEGGRLVWEKAYGAAPEWSQDQIAVAVCDINGDGSPDLMVWSEREGLQLYANRGNGNRAVQVRLHGHNMNQGQNRARCNADGVGVWAMAQARGLWAGQEYTTLSAGLGQSRPPLLLGVGKLPGADVLRLRWTDGSWQAELNVLAGAPIQLPQDNRLPGSCPILFAWDGRRFVFVNDFLGAGSIGETGADGACRPPRSEESVKIESDQLVTRDGQYVLKITEPMDETTYLDRLELAVIDQPPGVRVYPEERFVTAGPPPSQRLIAFKKEIHPVQARDHRGRNVTSTLRRWDRLAVEDFARRSWMGFAEEHGIELDFGDRLASLGPNDRLYLCLAGWTEYPFPESSWAAHQAGVAEQWPVLERQDDSGDWRSLGEAGFPAGLPRMTLLDVTGKLTGSRCRLRLRTNMHVCWDQVFLAADVSEPRAISLSVHQATLSPGRIVKERSPDGRAPALYDFDHHEAVPLARQSGRLTRFGDVTELLQSRDDRFVVFGPGDDLTATFDAGSLPPLPKGWRRSFVLRAAGYCKDNALSTAHGATVEPLPFGAMRNYPYGPDQRFPDDPLHRDYFRRYLTREIQVDSSPARR